LVPPDRADAAADLVRAAGAVFGSSSKSGVSAGSEVSRFVLDAAAQVAVSLSALSSDPNWLRRLGISKKVVSVVCKGLATVRVAMIG
jgi:hypothetical protein